MTVREQPPAPHDSNPSLPRHRTHLHGEVLEELHLRRPHPNINRYEQHRRCDRVRHKPDDIRAIADDPVGIGAGEVDG